MLKDEEKIFSVTSLFCWLLYKLFQIIKNISAPTNTFVHRNLMVKASQLYFHLPAGYVHQNVGLVWEIL